MQKEETHKAYLYSALNNSQDIIFTEEEILEIIDNIYSSLLTSPKSLIVKLATLIVHLDTGWFTGRHSWTFRQRIKEETEVDINGFTNNSYLFPEWAQNDNLTEEEFTAVRDRRKEEFKAVYYALMKGTDPKGLLKNHLCFAGEWDCGTEISCEVKQIILPITHEETTAVCIPYTDALDLFNSDDPTYPGQDDKPIYLHHC